ncbi:MAG: hypothetical protein KGD66_03940 [Candidatus Lokiarchaeota archaeon]|nr:hypothetical protein [Candidatus Lokiarchaeota archaeon]
MFYIYYNEITVRVEIVITSYALMFNVLEGGVSEPIEWSKDNLTDNRSVIILDESNQIVWLWHGSRQGLVARRTALRQADSLKGHGYTVGKSIIGRDLKNIMEIDQRKIGRDPTTDEIYGKLEIVLNRDNKKLENYVVTFEMSGSEPLISKPIEEKPVVKETKPTIKPVEKTSPEPIVKEIPPPATTPTFKPTNEYDIPEEKTKPKPSEEKLPTSEQTMDPALQAKIGFVVAGILDHYDDIWVSKKNDGSYSVEMMDGPICLFKVSEGAKISFSPDSFKGISTTVKLEIQKKFVSLSKLIL